jgi:hypothetical protein
MSMNRQPRTGFEAGLSEFQTQHEDWITVVSKVSSAKEGAFVKMLSYLQNTPVLDLFLAQLAGDEDSVFEGESLLNLVNNPALIKRLGFLLDPANEPALVRLLPLVTVQDLEAFDFWQNLERVCVDSRQKGLKRKDRHVVLDYVANESTLEVRFLLEYINSAVSDVVAEEASVNVVFPKKEVIAIAGGTKEEPRIPYETIYQRLNEAYRDIRAEDVKEHLIDHFAKFPQEKLIFQAHVIPGTEVCEIFTELIAFLPIDFMSGTVMADLAVVAKKMAEIRKTKIEAYVRSMMALRTGKNYVEVLEGMKMITT